MCLRMVLWGGYLGRDELAGEWRKLHNGKLNDLYYSPNYAGEQDEKNEMGWACSLYGG